MRYGLVDPIARVFETFKVATFDDALRRAGLADVSVDHGSVTRGVGIVVYQFSMFVPATLQAWFAFGPRLFGGFALLYGYDWSGRTCDLEMPEGLVASLRWFGQAEQVENAIKRGEIERPALVIDGHEVWRWPDPPPAGMIPEEVITKGTNHA